MKTLLVILFLLAVFLAAPIQTESAQVAAAQIASNSRRQISNLLDEWSKDWIARDAEAIPALYAQDAMIYPAVDRRVNPRDTVGDIRGPHAIRDYFKQLFERLADPKVGDYIAPAHVEESGDLAYDAGFIQYLVKGKCQPLDAGDGPCVLKGYKLMVLKRSSGGGWLIVTQSFTQIGLGSTIYTSR
jgi:ketosteroid isomerase-like protein